LSTRLLVIALDAFEKDLLLQWAASGELKVLAGLLRAGRWGVAQGPPGVYGGSVWPSFNTGTSPAKHRRFFRRQAPRGGYLDREFLPTHIEGTPFWEHLSAAACKVAVIDVPHSCLSAQLNGIQLVDWATHEPEMIPGLSTPASLRDEVASRFGVEPADICEETAHSVEGNRILSAHLEARIRNKTGMSRHYLESADWDFFITAFGEAHCAGHQWWHLHDPTHLDHDPHMAATTGDLMKDIYIALDRAVGEIVAAAGPDARVIVLCSHGMGPLHGESVVLDEILRRLDSPQAATSRPAFGALKRLWYRLPSALRGASALQALKGRLLPSFHQSLLVPDRQSRRFFAIPYNPHAGAIRINLVGRESHGIVQPGAEYRQLCESLRAELSALVSPETGLPAVAEVFITADLFDGPFVDELPDLLVQWSPQTPPRSLSSPRIGTVPLPTMHGRTGDHTRDGLYIALGPGLDPGRTDRSVAIVDFAPTFAALLGVPASAAFEGRVISELLGA